MNKFAADTKPNDSITVDYYTFSLPTTIVQFIKRVVKPTLLERCEGAIVVEKDLCTIRVIKDDESMKDSKDVRKNPQETMSKGKDKEETEFRPSLALLGT